MQHRPFVRPADEPPGGHPTGEPPRGHPTGEPPRGHPTGEPPRDRSDNANEPHRDRRLHGGSVPASLA